MTAKTTHVTALLTSQPDMSNVRIARITGATQYAVAKLRKAKGLTSLGWRTRGKAT